MVENIEKIITDLKLDRSAWELVTFGDVAIQQKQTVDRDSTHLTKYIKGEHMGSEDLHIREWGELTDEYLGPAFIRGFNKGDILYGSRRTYLRKVAIADFDGITSNTTFVVNANESKIDKRLLPFIMLSEGFAEHSIKNSKGSVNPYVNWKDLADYEFLLPPPKEQEKLAELLWAMEDVIEKKLILLTELNITYISLREKLITKSRFQKVKLSETVKNIITYGIVQPGPEIEDGIPYIQSSDIKDGKIKKKLSKTSSEIATAYSRSEVLPGDLIFSLRGNIGDTAIIPDDYGQTNMARGVARISPSSQYDVSYIKFALETYPVMQKILSVSQGSTFKEVSLDILRKIKVPIPKSYDEQTKIIFKLHIVYTALNNQKIHISQSKALQKSMINQIF